VGDLCAKLGKGGGGREEWEREIRVGVERKGEFGGGGISRRGKGWVKKMWLGAGDD